MRGKILAGATVLAVVPMVMAGIPSQAAGGHHAAAAHQISKAERDRVIQMALAAGIQVAPKSTSRPTVKVDGRVLNAPNPYLADGMNPAKIDWSYWNRYMRTQSALRSARMSSKVPKPFVY